MNASTNRRERVAITGVAICCAVGNGLETVWKAVRHGESGLSDAQRLDTSALTCRYVGEVESVPEPDRRPSGVLDRASKMALSATEEALDSSGIRLDELDPYRVGVALGTSVGGLDQGELFHWELLDRGVEATRRSRLLTYPLYTSADVIATTFGLKGPKVVISNACAAGSNSIGWASDTIANGRADVMVSGGVDVLDILSLAGFDSLQALDPEPCSPLSRSGGLNIGEGAAVLLLESESVAHHRGVVPLGYVLGYGLSSDAHHATAPDPSGGGAQRSMRTSLAHAGLRPDQVDYVNAHGTGTPANDSAEPRAVDALFGDAEQPPMSSTKSQVGHMLGAAGALEAAISVLALRDGVLPPTVNVDDSAAPERDIVPNSGREHTVRNVLSNSFAFGGNNCSLVVGADPPPQRNDGKQRRIVITGAGVVSALGTGRTSFVDAVASGQVGVDTASALDTSLSKTGLAAEINDSSHRKYIDRSYMRRLDQLGTLVLSSSRMALTDADYAVTRANSERVGMVFGTFTGPLETVGKLTETIGTLGPDRVSPRLFPNSVMNAAAGHACLSLQMKGPLSTLASGCASGLTGLGYAADLVRDGDADVMLAVSADELTPLLHFGFDRMDLLAAERPHPYGRRATGAALGAGGVALVVESLEHAQERGAPILAELTGHAMTSDAYRVAGNDPSGRAWAQSFRLAAEDAGKTASEITAVYGDARGTTAIDHAEANAISQFWQPDEVTVANLSSQAGHVHSTTSLLSAVCATSTCGSGWIPPIAGLDDPLSALDGYATDGASASGTNSGDSCMITAANWGGTYVSAVLSPWEVERG